MRAHHARFGLYLHGRVNFEISFCYDNIALLQSGVDDVVVASAWSEYDLPALIGWLVGIGDPNVNDRPLAGD